MAERVTKICLLRPADTNLLRTLQPLAETATNDCAVAERDRDTNTVAWAAFSLALMEHWRSNHTGAQSWCDKSVANSTAIPSRAATLQALLAIAHHHLGNNDLAHA
jgi:hypothetical protein